MSITLRNKRTNEEQVVDLFEVGPDTGIFRITLGTASQPTGGKITVNAGDELLAIYVDPPTNGGKRGHSHCIRDGQAGTEFHDIGERRPDEPICSGYADLHDHVDEQRQRDADGTFADESAVRRATTR